MLVRAMLLLIAAASLAAIWLDPFTYTMHPAGPELAPAWWKFVVVIDTGLLVWFAWSIAIANWRTAGFVMAFSIVFSLVMNAIYVRIRGVDRFLIIFQTEEILSLYLLLVCLRVVALFVCGMVVVLECRQMSKV